MLWRLLPQQNECRDNLFNEP
ncbi:hypothetical protein YPPY113_1879, partial [Yersinia pestis PY-113]